MNHNNIIPTDDYCVFKQAHTNVSENTCTQARQAYLSNICITLVITDMFGDQVNANLF